MNSSNKKGFFMLRIFFKTFISLLFVSVSLFATADGPDYFNVRGVAHNDVLWMRSQPHYQSSRIQGIPPNASCVQNLGCSKRWCKVSYRGVVGWVNGKYLGEGGCAQTNNHLLPQQTMIIPKVSWGACMVICDDIKFCKKADHNSQTSLCTLNINTQHSDYRRLYQRCSHIPMRNWQVTYQNDRWTIGCPN